MTGSIWIGGPCARTGEPAHSANTTRPAETMRRDDAHRDDGTEAMSFPKECVHLAPGPAGRQGGAVTPPGRDAGAGARSRGGDRRCATASPVWPRLPAG